MASNPPTSKSNSLPPTSQSHQNNLNFIPDDDDDDFQVYPSQFQLLNFTTTSKPTSIRPSKKPKTQKRINPGKENIPPDEPSLDYYCDLSSNEDIIKPLQKGVTFPNHGPGVDYEESKLFKYEEEEEEEDDEEGTTQLDVLLKLCAEDEMGDKCVSSISCPLCGADLSGISDELRQVHTNQCLDQIEDGSAEVGITNDAAGLGQCPGQVVDNSPYKSPAKLVDVSPVVTWLRNLGLSKYEEIFVREEIDWNALQWLTEEDLMSIGITALGPRKKIANALREIRNGATLDPEQNVEVSKSEVVETKLSTNKLITDYFPCPNPARKIGIVSSDKKSNANRTNVDSTRKSVSGKGPANNRKQKDVPLWCRIPGTPFRVDAFKFLRRDCSHWFLTHFHLDHYQGLTKSFCHGMIYCSSITAKLINMKMGIPWDKIQILPLNEKVNIAGTDVTCFDANHCPGAIIILFEPPNNKPVLHTGDFRFGEDIAQLSILQAPKVHTLILDTTYCDPQYDFPKQDAVIQFVIDAVQAEAFNPKTLFLIGSYTIGKEKLFIELGKTLCKKVYVTAAKLRLLECLNLPQEDMQWLTSNEHESHIHVVPMWSIASLKRLKHVSNQYMGRFSLIVAISPTGWTFGKGKKAGKKATGKRWQQGTIIRYEVPYSEHSSFTELQEFVKFISPEEIIPSVNNNGPDSQQQIVSRLLA